MDNAFCMNLLLPYFLPEWNSNSELLKHNTMKQSIYTQLVGLDTICFNAFLFSSLASYFIGSSWSILNDRSQFDIKKKKINKFTLI